MLFNSPVQATEWIVEVFVEIGNSGERVKFREKVIDSFWT